MRGLVPVSYSAVSIAVHHEEWGAKCWVFLYFWGGGGFPLFSISCNEFLTGKSCSFGHNILTIPNCFPELIDKGLLCVHLLNKHWIQISF